MTHTSTLQWWRRIWITLLFVIASMGFYAVPAEAHGPCHGGSGKIDNTETYAHARSYCSGAQARIHKYHGGQIHTYVGWVTSYAWSYARSSTGTYSGGGARWHVQFEWGTWHDY